MPARVVVFDAYGTLFDVASAARATAARWPALGPRHDALSRVWRDTQVGYSWWRTVTGAHVSFWQVTTEALDFALETVGLADAAEMRADLLDNYRRLAAYAEVPATLAALRARGTPCAILSNGAPDMLAAAVGSAGLADAFEAVLSVEAVGAFKPAAIVYDMVGARFGTAPGEVLFVSSNDWDAAGAAGYGFRTVWVNRAGAPMARLPHRPAHVVADLTAIPELAARASAGS